MTRVAHRRKGFTLFEMIMVISGLSIVLALCGSLLHTLLRLDRAGRESLSDSATVSRLSRQFRVDVRSSQEARPGGDGSLRLTKPEGPDVSYRLDGGRLLREETAGKQVLRRESYTVARLVPLAFEVEGKIVLLSMSRRTTNQYAMARPPFVIEAGLGKDRTTAALKEDRR
jgi:hypothetical protein